jgi:hypothetical protein
VINSGLFFLRSRDTGMVSPDWEKVFLS